MCEPGRGDENPGALILNPSSLWSLLLPEAGVLEMRLHLTDGLASNALWLAHGERSLELVLTVL